ncbi:MAG: zf-TFIIB domain-containing protein [Pseudomonadota bacterium]
MSSPIDGSPMREIERYGVKIDICQTSGGIWLDKGELEKIIMMIREEALHEAPPPPPRAREDHRDDRGYDSRNYEDRDYEDRGKGRPRRKKRDGIFDNIMDIFDM